MGKSLWFSKLHLVHGMSTLLINVSIWRKTFLNFMIHHCFFLINFPSPQKTRIFFAIFPYFYCIIQLYCLIFLIKLLLISSSHPYVYGRQTYGILPFFQKVSKHHGSIAFFLTPKSSRHDLVKKKGLLLENDFFS